MRPNILFIVSDQHRGDYLPYDKKTMKKMQNENLTIKMDYLRQMMDRGTTFTNCYTPSPICAPARGCLASGLRYERCEIKSNKDRYDMSQPTFYRTLHDNGYFVAGCGKFDLNKPNKAWEETYWVDEMHQMGFDDVRDMEGKFDSAIAYMVKKKTGPYFKHLKKQGKHRRYLAESVKGMLFESHGFITKLEGDNYLDNFVANNSMEMLEQFPSDKPWFFQINLAGPHNPFWVTKDMKKPWKNVDFQVPKDFTGNKKVLIDSMRDYAAELENIDAIIGALIGKVESRGELHNTIIVYTSDHGEMLGDKTLIGKQVPYMGSVHIPLVIDASRVYGEDGRVVESIVELQDLAQTFADFAETTFESGKDSISVKPILLKEKEKIRTYAKSSLEHTNPRDGKKVSTKMVVSEDGMKLHITADGENELFDIKSDPHEYKNIVTENRDIEEKLKRLYMEEDKI